MSLELIYTSAPRGLASSASGFCTVAATGGMSRQVLATLEGLSGYQFHFNLSDAKADLNPVNFAHTRVKIGSETRSVLSRIAFAGADYSGRTNKIAHHVLLERGEQMAGGPAWMMMAMARGVFVAGWDAEPRHLDKRSVASMLSSEPRTAEPATTWEAATGDAGWGGALVQAFRTSPKVPAYVVYEPGQDLLPLFEESLAVLPPEERWQVAFATYYTTLPAGCHYHWRGVLAGSRAAQEMRRFPNATVIDLTSSLGPAAESPFAEAARTGGVLPSREAAAPSKAKVRIKDRRQPKPPAAPAPATVAQEAERWGRQDAAAPTAPAQGDEPPPPREPARRRSAAVLVLIGSVVVLGIVVVVLGLLLVREWHRRDRLQQQLASLNQPTQTASGTVDDVAQEPTEPPAQADEPERQSVEPIEEPKPRKESGEKDLEPRKERLEPKEEARELEKQSAEPKEGSEPKQEPSEVKAEDQDPKRESAEPSVTVGAEFLDREDVIRQAESGGGLEVSPARRQGNRWEFTLGQSKEVQFLRAPKNLLAPTSAWSTPSKVNLVRPKEPGAAAFRLEIKDEELHIFAAQKSRSALDSPKHQKSLDCWFETDSDGRVSLVCEVDRDVQEQLAHPDWLTVLVLEVKDGDGVVYQCRMAEGEHAVTKDEVHLGFDSKAGMPLDPEECAVELPYPWIETLSVRLTSADLKSGAGGDTPQRSFRNYSTGVKKMPLSEKDLWHVELDVNVIELKDSDKARSIRLTFSMPAVNKLRDLAREHHRDWYEYRETYDSANKGIAKLEKKGKERTEADNNQLEAEKNRRHNAETAMKKHESFIEDRMKAMSRFLKGLGALEVCDAWGTIVATVELDFSKCDPDTLIKKSGPLK